MVLYLSSLSLPFAGGCLEPLQPLLFLTTPTDLNTIVNRIVQLQDVGVQAYKDTWDIQEKLLQQAVDIKKKNREAAVAQATENHFLFVEHPPVITLGKSGLPKHLLLNEELDQGFTFIKPTENITFHGPGQVVGYPI